MSLTYTPPKDGSKIIIVGGGCFGLSTALSLALKKEKKYSIVVYDREETIPVRDAASNDISKVVRMDYGDNRLNMELAIDSFNIWNQWNEERKANNQIPVYHNTGLLIFSGEDHLCDNELNSIQNFKNTGHRDWIEKLSPEELLKRYPYLENAVKKGFSAAYHNKMGGWCDSSESIKHVYQKCKENGVQFVLGRDNGCLDSLITDSSNTKNVIGIKTRDGEEHTASRVIITTGSWTPSIIDMKNQVIATGQVVIHFRPTEKVKEILKGLPIWFNSFAGNGFYGFPINTEGVMKMAKHSTGYLNPRETDGVSVPRTQVTNERDTIPLRAVEDFRQYLHTFLPITDELDITYARVCWYADSIDSEFIIAPHPDYDNLVIATGDSGHAMKFLPVIGTRISEVIHGVDNEYTRAWAWRIVKPRAGFYERPLLIDEQKSLNMATPNDLISRNL